MTTTDRYSEIPASLSISNTLVTLDGIALAETTRDMFRVLLEERPDDPEFRQRVIDYFEEARSDLSRMEGSEAFLAALGEVDDLLPADDSPSRVEPTRVEPTAVRGNHAPRMSFWRPSSWRLGHRSA